MANSMPRPLTELSSEVHSAAPPAEAEAPGSAPHETALAGLVPQQEGRDRLPTCQWNQ